MIYLEIKEGSLPEPGAMQTILTLFGSQERSSKASKMERKPIQQPSVRVVGIVQPRAPKNCNGVLHRFQRRKALTGFKVGLVQAWAGSNSPVAWHDHKPGSDAVAAIGFPFQVFALLADLPLSLVQADAGSVPGACETQH